MELRCPYCGEASGLEATHRHLRDAHADRVVTRRDDASGRMEYVVACPFCGQDCRHELRPRNRNPRFLEEFHAEIALIAFDQLLYHLLQAHPRELGVDPAALAAPEG
jgi:hypothetical protein